MSYTEVTTNIQTVQDVFDMIKPFAGGSAPESGTDEYTNWFGWIVRKQEEYGRRAFWRRQLTRDTLTLTKGDETVALPERFYKPNGLYMFIVTNSATDKSVDWNEAGNSDGQTVVVEMINDPDDENFGLWQVRFDNAVTEDATAVIWYFAQIPTPGALGDKLLLPGDMVGYAALSEYFRQANQEGSQDKAEQDAENRFVEYLALEVIPDKSELLTNSENQSGRVDRLAIARSYYQSRPGRNVQTY